MPWIIVILASIGVDIRKMKNTINRYTFPDVYKPTCNGGDAFSLGWHDVHLVAFESLGM